jgi:nonsense-mediated mRNA decay protein 3
MKFCFLCGKKTEKLIEGYCEKCYNKKFNLIKVPEKIEITLCKKCNSIKEKTTWRDVDVEKIIKSKIKVFGKKVDISIEVNGSVKIHAKGLLKKSTKEKEEYYEIPLKRKKVTCPTCFKLSGDYHEAIIQLRGDITREVIDAIDDLVVGEILNDKQVFYKIKEVRGGYDLYMSDKHITKRVSELLKKKFKAEIKKTYKLVTKKKGKDIYKSTVLVKL